MFQLPSLQTLAKSLFHTFTRYKWIVLIVFVKTILLIWHNETAFDDKNSRYLLLRAIFTAFIALPLALAVELAAERRLWKTSVKIAIMAILASLLALFFFTLAPEPDQDDLYRFFLFMAGAHLLVSFAPFLGFNEPNGFWQFNKSLFLQILNATLYAVTLYIGLLIAVETVKFLFNIRFSFQIEQDLMAVTFSLFHTLFFLSKIPEPLAGLEQETSYPSGLKIFTQYVLLPLEVIYLVILYVYTGKILVQWKLPEGGVAYLVLAFSTAGILALLLLYPLQNNQHERWINLFSRRFYLALLPLILLLFTGIFRRINDYGITENRYLVAVLAFWLLGITVYFLFGKKEDIRWIPVTLSIICFVLPIGPWNIFTVAKNSQLRQFHDLLTEYKLLDNHGKITGKAKMPAEDYEQVFSIARFFTSRDKEALAGYFSNLPKKRKHAYQLDNAIEDRLREHITSSKAENYDNYMTYSSRNASGMQSDFTIEGYEHLFFFDGVESMITTHREWQIQAEDQGRILNVYKANKKVFSIDIDKKIKELNKDFGRNSTEVPASRLFIDSQNSENRIRVVFKSLSLNGRYYSCEGVFLYSNLKR
ncbi:DUF4153 domain-containing protein [Dyadobacter flavalbus]|uniref:DUF4153 domain-containing protein n=1 Tax=Dyadobacter flavalbus TaxID=2579942 RepID=A0A5M8QZS1_9BACT|nr:DUF4153 domain-containing protein [Dyadobacter flavalbus]KAA6440176.1 DUF4153 domain-containing protein [Dyadobacter flavalbus]